MQLSRLEPFSWLISRGFERVLVVVVQLLLLLELNWTCLDALKLVEEV